MLAGPPARRAAGRRRRHLGPHDARRRGARGRDRGARGRGDARSPTSRRGVMDVLDTLQDELKRRYKDDPSLALTLRPCRPSRSPASSAAVSRKSVHLGHVAVCDARGRLAGVGGRPRRRRRSSGRARSRCRRPSRSRRSATWRSPTGRSRSCAPRTTASPVAPATACASLLRRGGARRPRRCGRRPARPLDPTPRPGCATPAPLFHNCSGKHAGMLLACVARGLAAPPPTRRGPPAAAAGARRGRAASAARSPWSGSTGAACRSTACRCGRSPRCTRGSAEPDAQGDLAPHVDRRVARDARRAGPGRRPRPRRHRS